MVGPLPPKYWGGARPPPDPPRIDAHALTLVPLVTRRLYKNDDKMTTSFKR